MPKRKSHLWKTRRAAEILSILQRANGPLSLAEIVQELEEMGRRISVANAQVLLKKLTADTPCVQRIGNRADPDTTWCFNPNSDFVSV